MKRPAIFFDRDNTLIACDGYLGDPSQVILVDGAAAAVARARQLGFATVVVSNQSGVARGMFDEEAVHAVNAKLDVLLLASHPGAVIDRHTFCPYHPDATVSQYKHDSLLRKPKPGMILEAARTLALDLSRSWLVGDAPRDIAAGVAAGCRTVLFQDPALTKSPAAVAEMTVQPEHICSTLKEAIEYIERHPTPPEDEGQHDQTVPDEAQPAPSILPPPARPTSATQPSANIRLLAQPAVPGTGKVDAPPAAVPVAPAPTAPPASARLEQLTDQILQELRRHREQPQHDFSVPKMLAGVVQVIAMGALLLAYFNVENRESALLTAVALQTLTTSLLLMGRK